MSAASDLAPGHCQEARQATAIKRKDNPYAPKWLSRNCGGLKPNAKPGVSQAKRKKYSSLRKYSNPHQRNGKTNQPNALGQGEKIKPDQPTGVAPGVRGVECGGTHKAPENAEHKAAEAWSRCAGAGLSLLVLLRVEDWHRMRSVQFALFASGLGQTASRPHQSPKLLVAPAGSPPSSYASSPTE